MVFSGHYDGDDGDDVCDEEIAYCFHDGGDGELYDVDCSGYFVLHLCSSTTSYQVPDDQLRSSMIKRQSIAQTPLKFFSSALVILKYWKILTYEKSDAKFFDLRYEALDRFDYRCFAFYHWKLVRIVS
ncbi:unnamed protein product [Acanthocheilonema viteae]|uniref:Uncharacterized protein n=1 Tax=Acanthocheilonema viteae TaxID=6277 RepID=A0A498RY06_ACAVI|nr:unnamed protein product [Acanthocheilonema viteae]